MEMSPTIPILPLLLLTCIALIAGVATLVFVSPNTRKWILIGCAVVTLPLIFLFATYFMVFQTTTDFGTASVELATAVQADGVAQEHHEINHEINHRAESTSSAHVSVSASHESDHANLSSLTSTSMHVHRDHHPSVATSLDKPLLLIVIAVIAFLGWLSYRSQKFRTVAISLLGGAAVLGFLLILGTRFMTMQEIAMESTSTLSGHSTETVSVDYPGEVDAYFLSWRTVLVVIAVTASLVFAFGTYVFLVSRKPVTEPTSSRFLQSALWALPVVLISAVVLLKYADHIQKSRYVPDEQLVRQLGTDTTVDPPNGGFAVGTVIEVADDLPLNQLEEKVVKLPASQETHQEVSETSSEATPIVIDYPDWVDRRTGVITADRPEGKVFRFTVMSDLFESNAAAVADALARLSQQSIHLYGSEVHGSALRQIPNEFLRESAIIHTYGVAGTVATEKNEFPMYRVWLDCEISTVADSQPYEYWKSVLVQHRMWTLSGLIGFFVLVFVALSGLFRLNHFSKGQFEKRLKLAYIILVLVAGFGVMSLMA